LDNRIRRHLGKKKKIYWHIDYLLKNANIVNVFYKEGKKRYECNIAKSLDENLNKIIGFGSSDCNCESHLFFGTYDDINKTIHILNMNQYLIDAKS
jgi:Uri superfamily endonuclease